MLEYRVTRSKQGPCSCLLATDPMGMPGLYMWCAKPIGTTWAGLRETHEPVMPGDCHV